MTASHRQRRSWRPPTLSWSGSTAALAVCLSGCLALWPAQADELPEADRVGIQKVLIGQYTFYIPKIWMKKGRFAIDIPAEDRFAYEPADHDYHADSFSMVLPPDGWKRLGSEIKSPLQWQAIIQYRGYEKHGPGPYQASELRWKLISRLTELRRRGLEPKTDPYGFWNWEPYGYVLL